MAKQPLDVWKAGGKALASSTHFKGLRENVISNFLAPKNLLVCSASENVTRILISACEAKKAGDEPKAREYIEDFGLIHRNIISGLFEEGSHYPHYFEDIFNGLSRCISSNDLNEDEMRANILQYGEIASSGILSKYLDSLGVVNLLIDARKYIKTKGNVNKAQIREGESEELIRGHITTLFEKFPLIITQGFIGKDFRTSKNSILPLDGSDTSAAFFALSLDARRVYFLKDVYGVWKESEFDDPHNIHSKIKPEEYIETFSRKEKAPVHIDAIKILGRSLIPAHISHFNCPLEFGTEIRN